MKHRGAKIGRTDGWDWVGPEGSSAGQLRKGLRLCGLLHRSDLGELANLQPGTAPHGAIFVFQHNRQVLHMAHTSPTRLAPQRLPSKFSKYCPPNQSDVDIFSLKFRCGNFVSCRRLASVALSSSDAASLMCHEVSLESLTTFDLIWSHNVQNRQQLFLCCRFFYKKRQQRPLPASPALSLPRWDWRCNPNARLALSG